MPVKVGLKYIDIWKESLEDQVVAYEKEDVEKGQIVFYGPSRFTRWSKKFGMIPMRDVLLGKSGKPCVVNRGFGSSSSEHQLYYYPRMIRPLEPKVLVYSSDGNGASFGYTDDEIWEIAQRVIAYAVTDFPDIKIYLCGGNRKKAITEESLKAKIKYNEKLKSFCEGNPNCVFVDVLAYEPLDREDIYVDDGIHYNQEGYKIYGEFFKEVLKEELEKY